MLKTTPNFAFLTPLLQLQLEASRATPALFRFNYDAMPCLTSLNLFTAVL